MGIAFGIALTFIVSPLILLQNYLLKKENKDLKRRLGK